MPRFLVIFFTCSLLQATLGFAQTQSNDDFDLDSIEEPSAPKATPKKKTSQNSGRKPVTVSVWKWNVGLGTHLASKTNFRSAGGSTQGLTFNSQNAYELNFGARYARKNAWGGFASFTYQTAREISGYDLGNGGKGVYTTSKPSIQISLIEGGAHYQWESFYLPFGINYSVPQYKDITDGSGIKTTVTGEAGIQAGVGYEFTDQFSTEVLFKSIGINAKGSGPGYDVDYGMGSTAGVSAQAKYIF